MHSIFVFLVSPKSTDMTVAAQESWKACAEYVKRHGTDDNGARPVFLLNQRGDLHEWFEGGAGEWLKMEKNQRWDEGMRFALRIVAIDLKPWDLGWLEKESGSEDQAYEALEAETCGQLIRRIQTLVPKKLSNLYSRTAQAYADSSRKPDDFVELVSERAILSRGFELFSRARIQPFAYPASPSDYRCYDLRTRIGPDPSDMMLFVDIHT